ncbi:MAG: hypothetical protein ABR583_15095 [Gaiellaceae bacterium]
MTIALVDARNVLRSCWPNLSETELVAGCGRWAESERLQALAVFDGTTAGVSAHAACAILETGKASADDWIAALTATMVERGQPYWLVTSDRELRERAGGGAERTIGGGTLARLL